MGRGAGSHQGEELNDKPKRKESSLPALGEGGDPSEDPGFCPLTRPESRGSCGPAHAAQPISRQIKWVTGGSAGVPITSHPLLQASGERG